MNTKRIGVIVGSLRKESFNRKMAQALIKLAPESLEMEMIEIGHLSMYNQDYDENPPKDWVEFRNRIKEMDAILFVSPEYNRSIPGVLKNSIDIGSRPYGHSVWDGKPAGIITVSVGAIGGFGSNHHLRQVMTYLNMPCMPQPEAYIGGATNLFGKNGEITVPAVSDLALKFINTFAAWVDRNSAPIVAVENKKALQSAQHAPH